MVDVKRDLGKMTVKELQSLARSERLLGWRALRKAELVRFLDRHFRSTDREEPATSVGSGQTSEQQPEPLPERVPEPAPGEMKDSDWFPPELPTSYGRDRLTLLVRDPQWLFCYWELGTDHLDDAREELGDDSFIVLRVYVLDEDSRVIDGWEERMTEGADSWYVHGGRPGGRFRVELGLSDGERFISLQASNPVHSPRQADARKVALAATAMGSPRHWPPAPGSPVPHVPPVADTARGGKP